jgi:hypothetical protein
MMALDRISGSLENSFPDNNNDPMAIQKAR